MIRRLAAVCAGILVLAWYGWVAEAYVRHSVAERRFAEGVQFLQGGDYPEARQEFGAAVSLDKDNAYYQAAEALALERLVGDPVTIGDIHGGSMFRHANRGRLEDSVRAFEDALKLNSNDDCFLHNLGWLYAMGGDWQRGRALVERALAVRNSAISRVSLGLMLERSALCERALEQYAEAVRLSPALVDSQFYQGLAERHPEGARRAVATAAAKLREALRMRASPVLAARLGKLRLSQGELDEAAESLQQASTGLPNMPRPWLNLAMLADSRGEPWNVGQNLRRATALDPGDGRSWYEYARLLDRDGQTQAAASLYSRVVALTSHPESEHARMAARVYQAGAVIRDDIVPNGLLGYCQDAGIRTFALKRLAELRREMGQP